MSSAVSEIRIPLAERSARATRDLCAVLGLGVLTPTNLKYLAVALMEVATEEAKRSDEFTEQVRSAYEAILPVKPQRRTRTSDGSAPGTATKSWKVKLTPIGTVDEALLDPYAPPNPFALQQLYGNEQLPLALGRYSLTKLKEAVVVVQQRYPDTKPRRITKAGIVEYIMDTLTSGTPSD